MTPGKETSKSYYRPLKSDDGNTAYASFASMNQGDFSHHRRSYILRRWMEKMRCAIGSRPGRREAMSIPVDAVRWTLAMKRPGQGNLPHEKVK